MLLLILHLRDRLLLRLLLFALFLLEGDVVFVHLGFLLLGLLQRLLLTTLAGRHFFFVCVCVLELVYSCGRMHENVCVFDSSYLVIDVNSSKT